MASTALLTLAFVAGFLLAAVIMLAWHLRSQHFLIADFHLQLDREKTKAYDAGYRARSLVDLPNPSIR